MMALKLRDAHEFKPVLAEIESDPGSPLGPWVFWIVVGLVSFIIGWLCIGTVDIVVTARGKVIPESKQKVVQPLETGVVQAIFVKEGQHVHKGDLLMEIDPAGTEPVLQSAEKNLAYAQQESERIESQLTNQGYSGGSATQQALYQTQRAELESRLASKDQELQQVLEQLADAEAEETSYGNLLKVAQEKEQRLMPVQDLVPRNEWEQVEKDLLNYKKGLNTAQHKQEELKHKRAQLEKDKAVVEHQMQTQLLGQLADTEKRMIDYTSKKEEVTFRQAKQQIKSPVDGTIDQLNIYTVGGVVTPAQKLISIVPDDTRMVLEAQVKNQDIGFVKTGLPVTIKLDTFNYQKYGTLPGKVILVSPNSRQQEGAPVAPEPNVVSNNPQEQEKQAMAQPWYTIYVRPTKDTLMVDGVPTKITPGMAVTTEIIVGRRRIIEFFIYPVVKSFQDSVKLR